jgi:hypothetical protein
MLPIQSRLLSLSTLLLSVFLLVRSFSDWGPSKPKDDIASFLTIPRLNLQTRSVFDKARFAPFSNAPDGHILSGRDLHVQSFSNVSILETDPDDHTCAPGRPCKNGACCASNNVCGFGEHLNQFQRSSAKFLFVR